MSFALMNEKFCTWLKISRLFHQIFLKKEKQGQSQETLFCGMKVGLWVAAWRACVSLSPSRLPKPQTCLCASWGCSLLSQKLHPLTFLLKSLGLGADMGYQAGSWKFGTLSR